ncbi:hypothetical protein T02_7568 [Trichinella nativa]|uniref:Uncharacterized protein n=1 Tax=Trichinella nativa TaxID=6335 RepID=A0A0V1KJ14_9BILA|nr:hypothetical protein T02_7568 [Trichinella nativa]
MQYGVAALYTLQLRVTSVEYQCIEAANNVDW